MGVNARKLEEDEAKIDNLLHKIIESAKAVEELNSSNISREGLNKFYQELDPAFLTRMRKISLLIETILHLAYLADDIDLSDETITEQLGENITDELKIAIQKIQEARQFFDNDEEDKTE